MLVLEFREREREDRGLGPRHLEEIRVNAFGVKDGGDLSAFMKDRIGNRFVFIDNFDIAIEVFAEQHSALLKIIARSRKCELKDLVIMLYGQSFGDFSGSLD